MFMRHIYIYICIMYVRIYIYNYTYILYILHQYIAILQMFEWCLCLWCLRAWAEGMVNSFGSCFGAVLRSQPSPHPRMINRIVTPWVFKGLRFILSLLHIITHQYASHFWTWVAQQIVQKFGGIKILWWEPLPVALSSTSRSVRRWRVLNIRWGCGLEMGDFETS